MKLGEEGRLVVAVATAACAGLGVLLLIAPGFFGGRGFPLDDAWIHLVYGRSLARTATLAYNPGVAATGETSPLWAWVLAIPHWVTRDVAGVVALSKGIGFLLHTATALVAGLALPRSLPLALRVGGASLVAFHPDLVAASVSGMEVPLATVFAALLLLTARRGPAWALAAVAFLAPFARPEVCVITLLVHVAVTWSERAHLRRALVAAGATVASFAVLAARNLQAAGRPMPATFYVKFGQGSSLLDAERRGFGALVSELAGLGPWVALLGVAGAWFVTTSRRHPRPRDRVDVGAALLAGVGFLAASFFAVPPIDPPAFYHQRYALPALPLLLCALPAGLFFLGSARLRKVLAATGTACVAVASAVAAPARHRRLDNDAHNIDDVQVAVGRAVASVAADRAVWAVDAGAIRYFGKAFVVDMIGLNSPALLGPSAAHYLEEHPPSFLEIVPLWSAVDPRTRMLLRNRGFVARPSSPYTVTSFPAMAEHWLAPCVGAGSYTIRDRSYRFDCPMMP